MSRETMRRTTVTGRSKRSVPTPKDSADDSAFLHSESSGEDDSEDETANAKKTDVKMSDGDEMAKYNLDNYDEEESRGVGAWNRLEAFSSQPANIHLAAMGAFSNIRGLTFYRDNNEDPYINLKDVSVEDRRPRNLAHCSFGPGPAG